MPEYAKIFKYTMRILCAVCNPAASALPKEFCL